MTAQLADITSTNLQFGFNFRDLEVKSKLDHYIDITSREKFERPARSEKEKKPLFDQDSKASSKA